MVRVESEGGRCPGADAFRQAEITVKNRFRPGAVTTASIFSPFVATDRATSPVDGTEDVIQKY